MKSLQFIPEYKDHSYPFCCIYCGLSMHWCFDKKHCKTNLAKWCPYENGRKERIRHHVWGYHRQFI